MARRSQYQAISRLGESLEALTPRRGVRLLARLVLVWESLVRGLPPTIAVLALFCAFAWSGLADYIGGWLHVGLLGGFAAALVVSLVHLAQRLRWPAVAEVDRRLEAANRFDHRPMTHLNDRLVATRPDPLTTALWQRHRASLAAAAALARPGMPRPRWALGDRHALAGGAVLLAAAAGIAAGPLLPSRLQAAVSPTLASGPGAPPAVVDLTLSPPAYTGLAPRLLSSAAEPGAAPIEALVLPAGTVALIRVGGGSGPAEIVAGDAEAPLALERVDALNQQLEITLASGSGLSVSQDGAVIAEWPLAIEADRPPHIALTEDPGATEAGALTLSLAGNDDYGILELRAVLRLSVPPPPGLTTLEPDEIAARLIPPYGQERDFVLETSRDLSAHHWAGSLVDLRLEAIDGAGQVTRTDPLTLRLPVRPFRHPVAEAVADGRLRLARDAEDAVLVAELFDDFSRRPDRMSHDLLAYLGLRTVIRRIMYGVDVGPGLDRPPLLELMWSLALRIEEGSLGLARERLARARQALLDALAAGADEETLRQHIEELKAALDELVQALAEATRNRMVQGPTSLLAQPPQQFLTEEGLRRMLDEMIERLQDSAEMGARQEAQQLLDEIERLAGTLMPNQMPGTSAGGESLAEAAEIIEQLRQLSERQEGLMDQAYDAARQLEGSAEGEQRGRGGFQPQTEGFAAQEGLRRQLGEIMGRLGDLTSELPSALGAAEQDMREASEGLRAGDLDATLPAQSSALENLSQGMQGFLEQMIQQMTGGEEGQGQGRRFSTESGFDPFGRPSGATGRPDAGNVAIPDQAEQQRARAIRDELRRRLGDADRPELERQYLDRLLRRFQ